MGRSVSPWPRGAGAGAGASTATVTLAEAAPAGQEVNANGVDVTPLRKAWSGWAAVAYTRPHLRST
jgi:hypothetical protein